MLIAIAYMLFGGINMLVTGAIKRVAVAYMLFTGTFSILARLRCPSRWIEMPIASDYDAQRNFIVID